MSKFGVATALVAALARSHQGGGDAELGHGVPVSESCRRAHVKSGIAEGGSCWRVACATPSIAMHRAEGCSFRLSAWSPQGSTTTAHRPNTFEIEGLGGEGAAVRRRAGIIAPATDGPNF